MTLRIPVLMALLAALAAPGCADVIEDGGPPAAEEPRTPYDDFYNPPHDPRTPPSDWEAPQTPPGPPPMPPTCVAAPHADDAEALLMAGQDALTQVRRMGRTHHLAGGFLPQRMLVSALEGVDATPAEQEVLDLARIFWGRDNLPAFDGDAFLDAQWGNEQGKDLRVQVLDGEAPLVHDPLVLSNYLDGLWVTMEPVDPAKDNPMVHPYRLLLHFEGLGPLGHLLAAADTLSSPIELEITWALSILDAGAEFDELRVVPNLVVGSDLALWNHTNDSSLTMTAMGDYATVADLRATDSVDVALDSFNASRGGLTLTVARQDLRYVAGKLAGHVEWRFTDAAGQDVGRARSEFGSGASNPVVMWSCEAPGR